MEVKTITINSKPKFTNLEILKNLLTPLNIEFTDIDSLDGIEISRDDLLKSDIKTLYLNQVENAKSLYKTSKLTSLHSNSNSKQKFPQVNLLRQILKCNNLKMLPKVISLGYSKITGKKLLKRSYILTKI